MVNHRKHDSVPSLWIGDGQIDWIIVGQFSKMIDELNQELDENDLGVTYADLRVACLMFVDDVILIADTAEELQKALDVTYGFFCKNHLKISQAKIL